MRNKTLASRKKDFLPLEGEDTEDKIPYNPLTIKPLFKPREILGENGKVKEIYFQLVIQKSTNIFLHLTRALHFLKEDMKEELIGSLRLVDDKQDKHIHLTYQCTLPYFLNRDVIAQLNRLLNNLFTNGRLKEKSAIQRLIGGLTNRFNLYSSYSYEYDIEE